MPYIAKGRYYTYGVKATLDEVGAITGMVEGETVFCSQNFRKLTYDGAVWMCNDFVKLINGTGVTVNKGRVMVASTTANTVTYSTTLDNRKVIGVSVFNGVVAGGTMAIAIFGIYPVQATTAVTHGNYAYTSDNNGTAVATGTLNAPGSFGTFTQTTAAAGLADLYIKTHQDYT